jgi:hypothetical protein
MSTPAGPGTAAPKGPDAPAPARLGDEAAERLGEEVAEGLGAQAERRGEEAAASAVTAGARREPFADRPVAPPEHAVQPVLRRRAAELPGRPVPSAELSPRPWLAAALGVLAPGAGQVYLGQRDDALRHAMGAPLLLPWVTGVRSAWADATRLVAGRRPMSHRPELGRALLFALAVWVLVGGLVVGSVWLYRSLTRPTLDGLAPALTVPRSEEPAPAALAEERPSVNGESASSSAPGLVAELEARQREARARRLTLQAHGACEAEDWSVCAALAEEARRLEPRLVPAIRLYHRAALALESVGPAGSGEGSDRAGEPTLREVPP